MRKMRNLIIASLAQFVRNGCGAQAVKTVVVLVPTTWHGGLTAETAMLWGCVLFLLGAAWWGGSMARWARAG